MRTTLGIDPDVLHAAKELAEHRGTTAGKVLSELARKALAPKTRVAVRNGIRPLPRRQAGSPGPTIALVKSPWRRAMSTRSRPAPLVLGLAKRYGGQLATFDRTIPLEAVHGAVGDDAIVVSE